MGLPVLYRGFTCQNDLHNNISFIISEKMWKSVKVGILNTCSSGTTGRTETMPGNTAVTGQGGTTDNKTPCLLKLLTCFCMVQWVMLIVIAATLGAFLNANVSISGACVCACVCACARACVCLVIICHFISKTRSLFI